MKLLKRSALHNWSHNRPTSFNMGQIIPIACYDVVPGMKISHELTMFLRTQPLFRPLMHTVDIDIQAYFVPDRLVFDGYADFHTGGDDGMDSTVPPFMMSPPSTGYAVGSLAHHLGIPPGVPDLKHSAIPMRGYNLIRNFYFRDSQLQTEAALSTANGLDTTTNRDLLRACWKRDYFTQCRPESQLGPEVTIPLSGDAPVTGIGFIGNNSAGGSTAVRETNGATTYPGPLSSNTQVLYDMVGSGTSGRPDIHAVMDDVSAVDIRDLREASAVQRFLEFNNIFGSRLMEQLMARFGAKPQDYRLQMPEYLGSGHSKFQFSEVLQTAPSEDDPVGAMAGHGASVSQSNRFKYRVPEHGYIHVLAIVRPKAMYLQGLPRHFSRESRFDYFVPEFQDIGDQAVLKKEIYAASADPNEVFGFTPQYEEYRTIPSTVAGEFYSVLDDWHMGIKYGAEPSLNGTLVECLPTERVWPASSLVADTLMAMVQHKIFCRFKLRNRPVYRLM